MFDHLFVKIYKVYWHNQVAEKGCNVLEEKEVFKKLTAK